MIAYEELSVPATPTPLTAHKYSGATKAILSCETAGYRFTMDGMTNPSATVGQLIQPGDILTLDTLEQIEKFQAFSADTSSPVVSASIHVHYVNNANGFRVETAD